MMKWHEAAASPGFSIPLLHSTPPSRAVQLIYRLFPPRQYWLRQLLLKCTYVFGNVLECKYIKGWVKTVPGAGGGEETRHSTENWSSSFKKWFDTLPPLFDLKNIWSPRQPPAAWANGYRHPHDLTASLQRLLVNRTRVCDGKQAKAREPEKCWGRQRRLQNHWRQSRTETRNAAALCVLREACSLGGPDTEEIPV